MKLSYIVLSLFLGVGFIFYNLLQIDLFAHNSHSDPVEKVLNRARRELIAKYGWHPMGTLVSSPEGRLRRLGLHFQVQGPIPKDEIRKLLIEAAQTLEKYMMEEEELKDSLVNYPVNEYNVEIDLFFIDESQNTILHPEISIAGCYYGKLAYTNLIYVYSSEFKEDFPETAAYLVESYDEALQVLGHPPRNSIPFIK